MRVLGFRAFRRLCSFVCLKGSFKGSYKGGLLGYLVRFNVHGLVGFKLVRSMVKGLLFLPEGSLLRGV